MGLLLIIAAIILMILNPFSGAVVVGAVTLGVFAVVTIIQLLIVGTVAKGMKNRHDDFFGRGF